MILDRKANFIIAAISSRMLFSAANIAKISLIGLQKQKKLL